MDIHGLHMESKLFYFQVWHCFTVNIKLLIAAQSYKFMALISSLLKLISLLIAPIIKAIALIIG